MAASKSSHPNPVDKQDTETVWKRMETYIHLKYSVCQEMLRCSLFKLHQLTFDSCCFMLFPHRILGGKGTGLAQEHPLQTPMSSRYASCTRMHLGIYDQRHVFQIQPKKDWRDPREAHKQRPRMLFILVANYLFSPSLHVCACLSMLLYCSY